MEIVKENLERVKDMKLSSNSHESIEKGACIMEMVSYIAGEPWSDHPECACPILTEYAIRMNDRFNDEDRQKLKPLIVSLVGTRNDDDAVKIARKRFIMWRNVTVTYPMILDIIKAQEHAAALRKFQNTKEDMKAAAAYLSEHKEAIRKIADAYANAYANANANANAYANANANAYAYANAYANAYAYANADADAYAYADAYADAYAYADADADAYAYAYAYAKKSRSALADIAVETLRLAIEVGKPNKAEGAE